MSASKTPLTDGNIITMMRCEMVHAKDCRAIELRLNECVEALEGIINPKTFWEAKEANRKIKQAIANARKPL